MQFVGRAELVGKGIGVQRPKLPLIMKFIVVTLFLPEGLSFYIAGLRFTITRLTFLILTPMLILRFAKILAAGEYRFVLSDFVVLLTGTWMLIAVSLSQGMDMALAHAGPEVLEVCISYMITRFFLIERAHALSFVNFLCCTIGVVALLGLLEPLTGRVFLHEWVNGLTGYEQLGTGGQYRHGLLKGQGPLEHPLLFGLVCSIGFILTLSGHGRARRYLISACGIGVLVSFESAPLLGTVIGAGLLLYNRILSRVSGKWAALVAAATVIIFTIIIFSDDPSSLIVRYLTFDPQTGYYRLWTWDLAISRLHQSPWVGVGFLEFGGSFGDNPPSIDNFWLMFAVIYGYPGAILLLLSVLAAMLLPAIRSRMNLSDAETDLCTTLSIVLSVTMLVAYTVHLWGIDRILFGLLIGTRAHLGALGRLPLRGHSGWRTCRLDPMSKSTAVTL
jgi:hypothetical protein